MGTDFSEKCDQLIRFPFKLLMVSLSVISLSHNVQTVITVETYIQILKFKTQYIS